MSYINNELVEYSDLTKRQRMAIFLIAIGTEAASQVMSKFDATELENICRQISTMQILDEEIKNLAVKEFSGIIGQSFGSVLGGMGYARETLRLGVGEDGAQDLMGKIVPGGSTADMIALICELEPRQIYNLMKDEQGQTLAYLVSNLTMDKATAVIEMLEQEKREEILEYVGGMGEVPIEMLAKLAQSVKGQLSKGESYSMKSPGGALLVADMLNKMDKEVAKGLLARLEETNPDLAKLINKKMFSFDDIIKLSPEDLQRVTREIETNDLVIALKAVSKEVEAALMGSVSKRAAESLKDELEALGAVKVKIVEEAQERIIQVIKRLEEEGAIDLDQGGGDVIE